MCKRVGSLWNLQSTRSVCTENPNLSLAVSWIFVFKELKFSGFTVSADSRFLQSILQQLYIIIFSESEVWLLSHSSEESLRSAYLSSPSRCQNDTVLFSALDSIFCRLDPIAVASIVRSFLVIVRPFIWRCKAAKVSLVRLLLYFHFWFAFFASSS